MSRLQLMPSTVLFIDRFTGEGIASRAFKLRIKRPPFPYYFASNHMDDETAVFRVTSWRSSYTGPQCEIIFESAYWYINNDFYFITLIPIPQNKRY
jgi:hypothetical protein